MDKSIVGIDISKKKFDAIVLLKDGNQRHRFFANTREGFEQLKNGLKI